MVTVSYANINPGKVDTEHMLSLLDCQLKEKPGVFHKLFIHIGGPYLDVNRNVCTAEYYGDEDGGDYLLFVDSDIKFSPDDVRNLLSYAGEDRIVCGLYYSFFAKELAIRPVAGRHTWDEELQSPSLKPITQEHIDKETEDGLLKVDGAGAGFMMIPRTCINRLFEVFGRPMPWWICQNVESNKMWYGEDYMFCMRAYMCGFPTYLVPSVRVMHKKATLM